MHAAMSGTKLMLVEAAGELFAENGLEGTSIRAIAEKANANIAAVNYHFGSKENLYIEVLRHVVLCDQSVMLSEYVQQLDQITADSDAYQVFQDLIDRYFNPYLTGGEPEWHIKLVMRSLMGQNQGLKKLVDEVFRPDHEAIERLIVRLNPALTEQSVRLLAFSLMGQMSFYVFVRAPILLLLGRETFDDNFIKEVKDMTARVMAAAIHSVTNFSTSSQAPAEQR